MSKVGVIKGIVSTWLSVRERTRAVLVFLVDASTADEKMGPRRIASPCLMSRKRPVNQSKASETERGAKPRGVWATHSWSRAFDDKALLSFLQRQECPVPSRIRVRFAALDKR